MKMSKTSVQNRIKSYFESVLGEMKYSRILKISLVISLLAEGFILFFSGVGVYKVFNNHMFQTVENLAVSIRGAVVDQEQEVLFTPNSHGNVWMQLKENDLPDFDRRIRVFLKPFQIAKIKIFDLEKNIIYSTDLSIIGKTVSKNERLDQALDGHTISRLEAGKYIIDLEGEERIDLDIIETYLPVADRNGIVVGSFELYFDVTPYRKEAQRLLYLSLGIVFVVLFLVFGVLNFLMFRMVKTVCSNTLELETTYERIKKMALYDQLTNLPNRNLIKDRFEQMTAHASRYGKKVAILYMDLDNFKDLNDIQGHMAGDQFLKNIAKLLKSMLRKEDTVGRLGGDEFVILLGGLDHEEEAIRLAQKINNKGRLPVSVNGHDVYSGFSIGVAFFPNDGRDMETLFKHSDIAMYRAKEKRNSFELFTSSMNQKIIHRMSIEQKLRKAIERNELTLHYQPKIDSMTGEISGFEALLRWTLANGEIISPGQFIPIAEESHLILSIGDWVLTSVCEQIKIWESFLDARMNVAVNLSSQQFDHLDLKKNIKNILFRTGINPQRLELEITETTLMKDTQKVVNVLRGLKEMGVQSSIDDFGTGYSSLGYINSLPVDSLKIDQSFIQNIHEKSNRAIVRAVITLCKDIGLKTIAEGVETRDQYELLREMGCAQCQGYLFSPALPAHEAEKLIRVTQYADVLD